MPKKCCDQIYVQQPKTSLNAYTQEDVPQSFSMDKKRTILKGILHFFGK